MTKSFPPPSLSDLAATKYYRVTADSSAEASRIRSGHHLEQGCIVARVVDGSNTFLIQLVRANEIPSANIDSALASLISSGVLVELTDE